MGASQARGLPSTTGLESASCLQRAKSCLLLAKASRKRETLQRSSGRSASLFDRETLQRSSGRSASLTRKAAPAKLVSLAVSSLKVAPDGSLVCESPATKVAPDGSLGCESPATTSHNSARSRNLLTVRQWSVHRNKCKGYWGDRRALHFFLAKCGGIPAFDNKHLSQRIGFFLCARGVQKHYEAYVAIGRALRLPRPGWPRTRASIGAPMLRPSQWAGVESTVDADGHIIACLKIHKARGTIPSQIGRLSALQSLVIEAGHPRGHIPNALSQLQHLTKLSLSMNKLSGAIPSAFGNLSRITELSLHGNRLTGSIPTELGSLEQLHELDLCVNRLSGRIPSELGRLGRLHSLKLHWNRLSGHIPSELADAKSLAVLLLHLNPGLTGRIPTDLQRLTALRALSVGINNTAGHTGGDEALAVVPAGLRTVIKIREPQSDPPSPSSASAAFSSSSSERSTESSGSDSDSSLE